MNETHTKWRHKLGIVLITIIFLLQNSTLPVYANETIQEIVEEVADEYEIDKYLVMAIIEHESNWDPEVTNGSHIGLMQVSTRWHSARADDLGITDWYDPKSNVRLGTDYLAELYDSYEDTELVVMLYANNHDDAFYLHSQGLVSRSASSIIALSEDLRKEM